MASKGKRDDKQDNSIKERRIDDVELLREQLAETRNKIDSIKGDPESIKDGTDLDQLHTEENLLADDLKRAESQEAKRTSKLQKSLDQEVERPLNKGEKEDNRSQSKSNIKEEPNLTDEKDRLANGGTPYHPSVEDEQNETTTKSEKEKENEEEKRKAQFLRREQMKREQIKSVQFKSEHRGHVRKFSNGVAWAVPIGNKTTAQKPVPPEIIGHMGEGNTKRYLTRYGTDFAHSLCVERSPAGCETYEASKFRINIQDRQNRVLQKIITWHDLNSLPLPSGILQKAQVLATYWLTKQEVGSRVKLEEILGPTSTYQSVYSIVYLEPRYLRETWGITNYTGFSHETSSHVLKIQEGNNRWQHRVSYYNQVAEQENRFIERFEPGRPMHKLCRMRTAAKRKRSNPSRYIFVFGDESDRDDDPLLESD